MPCPPALLQAPAARAGHAPPVSALPAQVHPLHALADESARQDRAPVMVMGKGGVGKTTIAAAPAVALAARGRTVHLSTTDPAAHLAATLAGSVRARLAGEAAQVARVIGGLAKRTCVVPWVARPPGGAYPRSASKPCGISSMPGSASTRPAAETDTAPSLRPAHAASMPAALVTSPHFIVSAAAEAQQARCSIAYLARPNFAVKLAFPAARRFSASGCRG
jgi:hypothetical protein